MLKIAWFLIFSLLLLGCKTEASKIDYATLLKLIENEKTNLIILDVRTQEEYKAGHIPFALNIPVDELEKKGLAFNKELTIVVYCRSGHRSKRASLFLINQDFKKVYDFGALKDWLGPLNTVLEPCL